MTIPDSYAARHPGAQLGAAAYRALAVDVRAGLTAERKTLPAKWFYDERGSLLFDEITRLPEYYPTRAERAALAACAPDIARACPAETLIELGSGTSDKTRLLLTALGAEGTLQQFVPFDVDPSVLAGATVALEAEFPGLHVAPVVGDFERDLHLLPGGGRRLIAFLGSTIGNFEPVARAVFLQSVRAVLAPGDALLLGTDLVKDSDRLVAAYDDSAGVTAAFNRNLLEVLRRELGADVDPADFDHVAVWDDEQQWMEMRLRARHDLQIRIPGLDLTVSLARGEHIRTEVSAKFTRDRVQQELAAAGLRLDQWWTDPAGDVGLSLSFPTADNWTF